ncbi:HXXEE domain-containing protein [Methanogenium organophilum]|uniref:HXXEE domain-containing protein n=1 Tax=Methanogenium organophilum TaxID=2199 RepID=A0A9X9S6B6_METOG|nr:HXXEE domain-containing protein [Methanogenium organophilum]WAI02538.1 HXXEE domain-containing protein [Methanogenium organophilum]
MDERDHRSSRFSAAASWLHTHWQDGTPFLAIYTTIFLLIFVWPQGTPAFWIWICLPVYFTHQFEEYLWPGGFMAMLTQRFSTQHGTDPNVPLLTDREAYWINVGIIWVLFTVSAVFAMVIDPAWGLWVPCFTVLNGLSHAAAWIPDHQYNPGLAVSLALNIPVGTIAALILISSGIGSVLAWTASILIAVGLMAFIARYAMYRSRSRRQSGSETDPA